MVLTRFLQQSPAIFASRLPTGKNWLRQQLIWDDSIGRGLESNRSPAVASPDRRHSVLSCMSCQIGVKDFHASGGRRLRDSCLKQHLQVSKGPRILPCLLMSRWDIAGSHGYPRRQLKDYYCSPTASRKRQLPVSEPPLQRRSPARFPYCSANPRSVHNAPPARPHRVDAPRKPNACVLVDIPRRQCWRRQRPALLSQRAGINSKQLPGKFVRIAALLPVLEP